MEKWINIQNNSKIDINLIPTLAIEELRTEIIGQNKRLVAFFGQDYGENNVRLFVVLADDEKSELIVSSALFNSEQKSYDSITKDKPAFHIFEREFYEQFGIEPVGHPWLKPVRKNQDKYEFFEMEGEEVHQVAVGPIHAGVIEPGHFRFMCNGETVYHLEIMLGYQHRGVEDMMLKTPSNQLAESVCGDSVIAYNTAYSQVMETIKGIEIPYRAKLIRKMALEMERIAIHIGDMGAIAGDIGYLMGASVFGAIRTLVINTTLEFCGSRFGRGFVTVGGVNFDIDNTKIEIALKTIEKVSKDVERMTKTMLKSSTVMSRLEKTGSINLETAKGVGLVGLVARATGLDIDSRYDFPDEVTSELKLSRKPFNGNGDVYSRFKLRYKEIKESISIVKTIFARLNEMPDKNIAVDNISNGFVQNSFAISIVEGWRGEVVHIGITDNNGKLSKYKIKDPSFNNWYGLGIAVRTNGISDFPLCNKSFDLSYAGNDL